MLPGCKCILVEDGWGGWDRDGKECDACVVYTQQLAAHACLCGKEGTKKCATCKTQWYCSRACQKRYYQKTHKKVCLDMRDQRSSNDS